ncbi:hypothetical protein BJY52DRAFT_1216944 [Lactarius psammicola]|nr:hypothetical protein BJY52DRAFT_1216944 [Lactarius psammicola]
MGAPIQPAWVPIRRRPQYRQHYVDAPILDLSAPISAAHVPSFLGSANADGTYTDVPLPLGREEPCMRITMWNDLWRTSASAAAATTTTTMTVLANRAPLGPPAIGSGNTHDPEVAHILCGPQRVPDHVGRPAAAVDGRNGRAAVRRRLPAEDRLLSKPAGDAPHRRRQVRHAPEDLRKRLMVKFEGENALDHGRGRFEYLAHDNYTLQIDLASGVNPEHLNCFKSIGHVLPSLYSTIGSPMDNDISSVLDETFFVTEYRIGGHVVIELRPDSATQDVTGANQKDFMEWLWELLPLDLLRVFDEHEHELLIGEDDGDQQGRLDAVYQLLRVREDEPGDRVVLLDVPPVVGSDGSRPFTTEESGDLNGLPRSHTSFICLDPVPFFFVGRAYSEVRLFV